MNVAWVVAARCCAIHRAVPSGSFSVVPLHFLLIYKYFVVLLCLAAAPTMPPLCLCAKRAGRCTCCNIWISALHTCQPRERVVLFCSHALHVGVSNPFHSSRIVGRPAHSRTLARVLSRCASQTGFGWSLDSFVDKCTSSSKYLSQIYLNAKHAQFI